MRTVVAATTLVLLVGASPPASGRAEAAKQLASKRDHPSHRRRRLERSPGRPFSPKNGPDIAARDQKRGELDLRMHESPRRSTVQVEEVEDSSRLRKDLLEGYDKGAYPWKQAWALNGWNSTAPKNAIENPRSGLPVQLGINFHRVFSVDIKSSIADLVVWFRQSWTDPRLSWDPEDYGGLDTTWFWVSDGAGGSEASEIWAPDLELWNMESSTKNTLTDSYAQVNFKGEVFWSRPGHLRPTCKFEGLEDFPFDELTCLMEIGSWSHSGLYIRPVKMGGTGFTFGGSDTAGEAYSEYSIAGGDGVECWEHIYPPYPQALEEDWPVLMYKISFHRSWQPYMRGYLLLQIILNFAAFTTFWLPVQCGERMALAITAMLAAVASELVVAANLPSASEMTWFQSFSIFSLVFAAFALFESAVVIYFFYHTKADLVPRWWKWLNNKVHTLWGSARTNTTAKNGKKDSTTKEESNHDDRYENERTSTSKPMEGSSATSSSLVRDPVPVPIDTSLDGNDHTPKLAAEQAVSARCGPENGEKHKGSGGADQLPPARMPLKLSTSARDADDFKDVMEAEHNLKWKAVAHCIDEVCRVVIPTAYIVTLAILLNQIDYYGGI